mgnify:CR=1 FL=1
MRLQELQLKSSIFVSLRTLDLPCLETVICEVGGLRTITVLDTPKLIHYQVSSHPRVVNTDCALVRDSFRCGV